MKKMLKRGHSGFIPKGTPLMLRKNILTGDMVKAIRKAAGLSARQLAEVMEKDRYSINLWEQRKGERVPNMVALAMAGLLYHLEFGLGNARIVVDDSLTEKVNEICKQMKKENV